MCGKNRAELTGADKCAPECRPTCGTGELAETLKRLNNDWAATATTTRFWIFLEQERIFEAGRAPGAASPPLPHLTVSKPKVNFCIFLAASRFCHLMFKQVQHDLHAVNRALLRIGN